MTAKTTRMVARMKPVVATGRRWPATHSASVCCCKRLYHEFMYNFSIEQIFVLLCHATVYNDFERFIRILHVERFISCLIFGCSYFFFMLIDNSDKIFCVAL